jgi:hypothetical protein
MATGLIVASAALKAHVRKIVSICKLSLRDLDGWEDRAKDPALDPESWGMRKQLQETNDCQGQSLANGGERRRYYETGDRVQLSDLFAYQRTEMVDNLFGRDSGTSIEGGATVVTTIGLPEESLHPYHVNGRLNYLTNRRAFEAICNDPKIQASCEQNRAASFEPAPDFDKVLAGIVCGGSLHWGTMWPLRWDSNRVLQDYITGNAGGHATEGVWVRWHNGDWQLKFLNSHGDGYYYVTRKAYENTIRKSPFGAFLILPKDPIEQFYRGQFSLMG